MPFENEHSCRLREPAPKGSETGRIKRRSKSHKKTYWVIRQRYPDGEWYEQAYRYPTSSWSADEARSHCRSHKGRFEKASDERADVGTPCVQCGEFEEDLGAVYPIDTYWAIQPEALNRILAVEAWPANLNVAAGPAAQAQKIPGIPIQVMGGVAVISIQNVMEKRMSFFSSFFGGTSMLAVKAALNAALADRSVDSILLRIDSPGGSVLGLADLADAVRVAGQRKPLAAHIDGRGASAAYYVASQASSISAGRTDMVGSIGTIMVVYDLSEKAKQEGIRPVVVTDADFKTAGTPGTKISPEQIAEWRKMVNFYGDDFRAAVSSGRGIKVETIKGWQGRVFTAPEALTLRLIDSVQTFEESLAGMREIERAKGRTRTARAQMRLNELG